MPFWPDSFHLATIFSRIGPVAPTAPSLPPVLIVSADLASTTANLAWTASNKTGSPGFGYRVYSGSSPFGSLLSTTTGLSYDATSVFLTSGNYSFYVVPFNDVGEGPSSNTASVVLPGESDGPVLSGPDSAFISDYTLTWTAIAGATSYDLYASRDNTTYSLYVNTAATSWLVSFDFPGMYHKVIAKNGSFESGESNVHYVAQIMPSANTPRTRENGSARNLEDGTPRRLEA